jgi:hypothetical protein
MFLLRQISARLLDGEQETVGSSRNIQLRVNDVLPSTILRLEDGDCKSESVVLNASDTYAVPLPQNYASTDLLQVFLKTNVVIKVTVVSPDEGTSNYLVKGTEGTTDGEHEGILCFTGTVTSITITIPSGSNDAQVDFAMFKLPDLTLNASYRSGSQTTGVENGT